MATYVKGDAVENASSYELFEKKSASLIDMKNPTSAPSCWAYNESQNTWTATDSNSANLRWDIELEAGVTVIFSADVEVNSGSFIMTIRDNANSILQSTVINKTGTFTTSYTTTAAGTYSFRTAGNQAENSAVYSNISVKAEGSEDSYVSLGTNTEINFEVSAIGLATGNHTLVVKAKANGYEDSDLSNEVIYTVAE